MEIITRKVADLSCDPANARQHPQRNLDAIVASLRRFGQQKPIVVDKSNVVRAGNGTLEAAKLLGWDTIQCVHTELESVEATAYAIADNRTAELAEWDDAILAATLESLDAEGVLADVGFDEKELQQLLATVNQGEIVEDEVPEPPEIPITKPGDLWIMGEHRLMCGDSTKAEDVGRVMNGERADMVWTDPPYGVNYEGGRNPESNVPREKLKGDASGALYESCMAATIPFCRPSAPWYVWFAGTVGEPVYSAIGRHGMKVRAMIVWNKLDAHYGNFMAQYMQKHEPCLYCVRESPPWEGPTNEVTVWDLKQPSKNEFHPTQKPVELAARAITNSSIDGAIVCDWFLGSGTTLIAAEQLNRRCYAMEIEPRYVDIAVKRWENLTGRKAVLE